MIAGRINLTDIQVIRLEMFFTDRDWVVFNSLFEIWICLPCSEYNLKHFFPPFCIIWVDCFRKFKYSHIFVSPRRTTTNYTTIWSLHELFFKINQLNYFGRSSCMCFAERVPFYRFNFAHCYCHVTAYKPHKKDAPFQVAAFPDQGFTSIDFA